MNHCCVISCLNKRRAKRFRFFNFPQDPIRCQKWVEFCHCPETSERFTSGGASALRKHGICSEHFDQRDVKLAGEGPLPPRVFPINIGRTHMTSAMLAERGFILEVEDSADESADYFEMPEVLVEMLEPDEVKMELPEDESGLSGRTNDPLQSETINVQVEKISQPCTAAKKPPESVSETLERAKCKKLCLMPDNAKFSKRHRLQVRQNKKLEETVQKHKSTLAILNARLQRYTDLRALKKAKREKLRVRYMELRKLYKSGVVPAKEPAAAEESEEDDFDENNVWWT